MSASPWAQLLPTYVPPCIRIAPVGRKKPIDRDALFAYRLSGKTIAQCARHFNCTRQTIENRFPDLPKVSLARGEPKVYVDAAKIVEQRLAGMKLEEIAAYHKCGEWVVRNRLELAGIKPRKQFKREMRYCIGLTEEQNAFVQQMGGASWLRNLIDISRTNELRRAGGLNAPKTPAVG